MVTVIMEFVFDSFDYCKKKHRKKYVNTVKVAMTEN